MDVPKLAVIGCGTVAQRYYAPALKRFPDIMKKILLVDRERDNAEAMRKLLGAGEMYRDHKEVIGQADGALILVPHDLHYPVSMDFLGSGVHVLCEKPLALMPGEAREMIITSEMTKAALCMNNTRRLFPSFSAVHDMISSGELGRIRRIRYLEGGAFGWPSSTGFYVNPALSSKGVLLDLGSHVMDTICWWIGGKPELGEFADDSRGGPESVAQVAARKGGCEIRVVLNRLCDLNSIFEVVGEKGEVMGKVNDWGHISVRTSLGETRQVDLPCRVKSYQAFVVPVLSNFIRVVQGLEKPLVTGRDVLASVEIIHECYENRRNLACAWERRPGRTSYPNGTVQVKDGRRILVTGATGFIGGRIIEMLHRYDYGGDIAKAGLRQWSSAARLGRVTVPVAIMDLMKRSQVGHALDGITHVIHCAKGTPEATVEGTRNLLQACLSKGVRHVVHLSTAEVYGNASGIVDEHHPCRYTGNPYNRMKIEAEKICREYLEKGLPITIFRPSIVYGPFSSSWSLRFAAMFKAGEWGILEGYGEGTCNLVYVDDLVNTIHGALDNAKAVGRAFNVNGPEVVSWNRYFTMLNNGMGFPALKTISKSRTAASAYVMGPVRSLGSLVKKYFMTPVKKAADLLTVLDTAMRNAEHAVKITPSKDELTLFSRRVIYTDDLARSTLACCPEIPVEEGIGKTVEWLRYLGLIQDDHDWNTDHSR